MTSSLSLIFMGTPEFGVPILESLIASRHQVIAVYTQPPRPAHRGKKETKSPVHELAEKHGIAVHTPISLKDKTEQEKFTSYKVDAAIVAAYGLLLPKLILEAPKYGCLNVHTSKLPRWRGAAPIQRAIMAGDKETSITIMQMDAGLDTGPILLEQPIAITPEMDAGALHDLMAAKAGALVLKALEGLPMKATPQSTERVTYAPKITKEECQINWAKPGEEIVNHIRGLSPHPGAFFLYNGERIKVFRAMFEAGKIAAAPGTVVDERLGIACADGIVRLLRLQREGKQPMDAEEFLRGFTIKAGFQLSLE